MLLEVIVRFQHAQGIQIGQTPLDVFTLLNEGKLPNFPFPLPSRFPIGVLLLLLIDGSSYAGEKSEETLMDRILSARPGKRSLLWANFQLPLYCCGVVSQQPTITKRLPENCFVDMIYSRRWHEPYISIL